MNRKTTIGIVISIGLIAGLASASHNGTPATPQGDAPKPKPSASAPAKEEKPKAPKPAPKKPDEGGW